MDHARHALQSPEEEKQKVGLQLLSEAIMVYEQTLTRMHPETAKAYGQAAMIYFQLKQVEQVII